MASLDPALPWSIVRLISARRVKQHRTVTAVIVLAVAAAAALSFVVTALTGVAVRGLTRRVALLEIPFDAVLLFAKEEDADAFRADSREWSDAAEIAFFRWARLDSPAGAVTALGVPGMAGEGGPLPVSEHLPGWRFVEPSTIAPLGSLEGALFRFSPAADRESLLRRMRKLETRYSCTAVTESSGRDLAAAASRGAYASRQAISLGVILTSASAIACILAVTFLGRKRNLGILKVLGSTTRGLRRLFMFEAALMGAVGIPLGFLLGSVAVTWSMGPAAMTAWCFAVSAGSGMAALALGVLLPVRLVRNGSCDQLLNNRPVYAMSNPSCAKCGLCGGF